MIIFKPWKDKGEAETIFESLFFGSLDVLHMLSILIFSKNLLKCIFISILNGENSKKKKLL